MADNHLEYFDNLPFLFLFLKLDRFSCTLLLLYALKGSHMCNNNTIKKDQKYTVGDLKQTSSKF